MEDNDLDERGYFIYHGVGTNDTVKSQSIDMAEEMLSRSDVFTPDHYVFYQREGGQHDHISCREFMYNALPLFFGGDIPETRKLGRLTENLGAADVVLTAKEIADIDKALDKMEMSDVFGGAKIVKK